MKEVNRRAVKQEENFENYFDKNNINIYPVSTYIKIEEEEDSKSAAEGNLGEKNRFVQAEWRNRINQDNINNSTTEQENYTLEERFLLTHFDSDTRNCASRDSTPTFILAGETYFIPSDIWVHFRASCECLRKRVLPFLTNSTTDLDKEQLYCAIIILADTSLTIHQGFPNPFIKESSKWHIPGQVRVDKVTFEQARIELWIYYHTCLKHNINISYLLEFIESVDLEALFC